MTLEEKASLCGGADFWHTKAVERLGIPRFMMSDGPHGLRKQENVDENTDIKVGKVNVDEEAVRKMAASEEDKVLNTLANL